MENEKEKFKKEFIERLVRFTVAILHYANKLKGDRVLWPVSDQLIRSASSIGANVVEAKSSSSRRDYLKFFEIALKSANETKYWLIVVGDYDPKLKSEVDVYYKEADELSRVIGSSVLTLKGKK